MTWMPSQGHHGTVLRAAEERVTPTTCALLAVPGGQYGRCPLPGDPPRDYRRHRIYRTAISSADLAQAGTRNPHRLLRRLRRAGAGAQHGPGDVQRMGQAAPGAGVAPRPQRPHGADVPRFPAPLRRYRHGAHAEPAAGGPRAGTLHGRTGPAGRADRLPPQWPGRQALEPGRAGAVRVLPGRQRPRRGDPGASVGHDGHRHHAEVLAAVVVGCRAEQHAQLLPGVRRRAGTPAETARVHGPRRRQASRTPRRIEHGSTCAWTWSPPTLRNRAST